MLSGIFFSQIIFLGQVPVHMPLLIVPLFPICFSRLHKLWSLLFTELDSGDQLGHLLVATRLLWVCFCSPQLRSLLGFLLCQNSRLVCSSTKHSAEVYRSLVFLAGSGRIVPLVTRSKMSDSESRICGNLLITLACLKRVVHNLYLYPLRLL